VNVPTPISDWLAFELLRSFSYFWRNYSLQWSETISVIAPITFHLIKSHWVFVNKFSSSSFLVSYLLWVSFHLLNAACTCIGDTFIFIGLTFSEHVLNNNATYISNSTLAQTKVQKVLHYFFGFRNYSSNLLLCCFFVQFDGFGSCGVPVSIVWTFNPFLACVWNQPKCYKFPLCILICTNTVIIMCRVFVLLQ
jgi:hypothetical protein